MHVGQLVGGLEIYIRNSIAYSSDKEFDFILVHGKNDENKLIFCGKMQVKEYKVDLYRSLNPINDVKCLWQVIRLIKKEKPDIIHCHSAKGGFIGRIAGWLSGAKTLYTPHAFSFLCSHSKVKKTIFIALERIARLNSYLLACSESERQMGMKVVGYKKDKAVVWHNSVPDASEHHGEAKIEDERFISYIGRPCFQKNPFFLLDVIRKVTHLDSELKFYLLGVGFHSPDLDEMKHKIEEYGIGKNIRLIPWLKHDDCMEYVRNSMFYLTCSLYEGLPLSVIEAMSLGKAVIASNVIGNKDCVKDQVNGYLLQLDVAQFTERILYLINNEKQRKQFGLNSRKIFSQEFLIESQISKLHHIYMAIFKNKVVGVQK